MTSRGDPPCFREHSNQQRKGKSNHRKKAVMGSETKRRRPAGQVKRPHSLLENWNQDFPVTCFWKNRRYPCCSGWRFMAGFQTTGSCFVKWYQLCKVSRDWRGRGWTKKEVKIIAVHSDQGKVCVNGRDESFGPMSGNSSRWDNKSGQ